MPRGSDLLGEAHRKPAMARYTFTVGKRYPARLHTVWEKPLENERLQLLRLEFEVFLESEPDRLSATGKIACRDLAVGRGIDLTSDPGVMPFVNALGVRNPNRLADWLALNEDKNRWVAIEFGPSNQLDQRNEFFSIRPFDPAGRQVGEYDFDLHSQWVSPQTAADDLGLSASTVRRLVAQHEPEWGANLVRRTQGAHRRINLYLLRNVTDGHRHNLLQ
jgi:hypothetical protein